jgi:hypothetical protein
MQKDKVHDLDAQGDLGQLSIEDTATVRARLGRAGSAPFDPCNGLEQRSPTAKKDLRKLGEWIKAKQKAEELAREAEQTAEALKDP